MGGSNSVWQKKIQNDRFSYYDIFGCLSLTKLLSNLPESKVTRDSKMYGLHYSCFLFVALTGEATSLATAFLIGGKCNIFNIYILVTELSLHQAYTSCCFPWHYIDINRIGRLWRDVRVMVTNRYYEILHSLEADGLLDISSTKDVFCVHHTILPRLQSTLEEFVRAWNFHSLRTERSRSPEQLWMIGMMTTDIIQPDLPEVLIVWFNTSLFMIVCEVGN